VVVVRVVVVDQGIVAKSHLNPDWRTHPNEMSPKSRTSLLIAVLACLPSSSAADPCDCIEGPWTYRSTIGANENQTFEGGCVVTNDWHVNWCYVKDNSCIHSMVSIIPGETRNYKQCSPCNCRGEAGCQYDAEYGAWCYTQGSKYFCDSSDDSQEGNANDWRNCDPCQCMKNWNYMENGTKTMKRGCYKDAGWGDKKWCYVDGYANCKSAKASEIAGEARYWKECHGRDTCAHHKADFKFAECCGNPSKKSPWQKEMQHYEP